MEMSKAGCQVHSGAAEVPAASFVLSARPLPTLCRRSPESDVLRAGGRGGRKPRRGARATSTHHELWPSAFCTPTTHGAEHLARRKHCLILPTTPEVPLSFS